MARRYKREGQGAAAIMLPKLRAASHYSVDKSTKLALGLTQQAIVGAGLGRLSKAVSSTSSTKKGKTGGDFAYGAIYARGATESRGNKALLSYSEGATIVPNRGKKWLAFPTGAIPKRVGRLKMTPELYRHSALVQTIGPLQFVQGKKASEAFLVAKKVTVSRRTGRAKANTGRVPRGADAKKGVVAFILIKFTKRAQRFDQNAIMARANRATPIFAQEYLERE
jgi:hypothetical protein